MQLRVLKCDGSLELYLHTKVMGSLAAALADAQRKEITQVDQLAEAVTTYLKKRFGCGKVDVGEIHAMLLAVLMDVGCEKAALALHEHRVNRQLKRQRLEVIAVLDGQASSQPQPWNKSIIAHDLECTERCGRLFARSVAGAVEERVLNLGLRQITTPLIRELVRNELMVLQRAEESLSLDQQTQWVEQQVQTGQLATIMV